MAVCGVVHLVTGGLAVGGALLIVLGWETVVLPLLGILLIGLALHLRPRFGRDEEEQLLGRADAPLLFALLDETADAVGTRGCDAVRLTPGLSIGAAPRGLRGRRLDIGLGLWATLTPQQRVACLAHALGHFATGDVRYNLVVRTALPDPHRPGRSSGDPGLLREQVLAAPSTSRHADEMAQAAARFRVDSALARWGGRLAAWPLRLPARSARRLVAPVAEEAEFRSDALAARVASTGAAVQALERLARSAAVETELRRLAVEAGTFRRRDAARDLWRSLAAHTADLPDRGPHHEVTQARIDRLSGAEWHPGSVRLGRAAADALDRELEPAARAVAERSIRDGTGPVR
ncbi:M48 family metallopeptidase [Streptomyces poriticola]|uniref:M48 family metallopeptidase n=1 Tax=Streptomyces poriticola TaxID=3120506 RepID=UPI002FCE3DAD